MEISHLKHLFPNSNERFHALVEWIGVGSPDKSLWFIGIEEGGKWTHPDRNVQNKYTAELNKRMGHPFKIYEEDTDRSDINNRDKSAQNICKIAAACKDPPMEWEGYRETELWTKKGNVFKGNILPIGKESLKDYPDEYNDYFGVTRDEYIGNYEELISIRMKEIRNMIGKFQPQAIICFGKTSVTSRNWEHFTKELNIDQSQIAPPIEVDNRTIKLIHEKNIILCDHLSNPLTESYVNTIAECARDRFKVIT